MYSVLKKNVFAIISFAFFLVLSVWWLTIVSRGLTSGQENNAFTLIYPWMSLFGGLVGLFSAKKWGGLKSYLGGSLVLFSWGLLAQFFGQACYAFYIYVMGVEVPYPSLGDVGYFGSIIFYILGIILMGKVLGLNTIKSKKTQILVILVPGLLLMLSYLFFLDGYTVDWTNPLRVLLDFGYPLGEAMYVSVAVLNILLSAKILGGIMRGPTLFLISALIFQYFSDFMFLYQASRETWYVGGINDYLYFVSYFLMTIGLLYIGGIFKKIKES